MSRIMDDNAVISICYPGCFATALMCDFQEDREALTEPKNDPNYMRSSEDWLKERVAPKESGTTL